MENKGYFTATFNVDIAKKFGTDAAIMLQNIIYWCDKNKANDKHFYEGSYWTYNSTKAFGIMFPYLTSRQIETVIGKLVKVGVLKVGNFNNTAYDRTRWFTVDETSYNKYVKSISPNQQMEKREESNPNTDIDKPIPNTSHRNTNEKHIDGFEELIDFINQLYGKKNKGSAEVKRHFKANLKEGWSVEDMKKAAVNVKQDKWHKDKNYGMCSPEYLIRPSNMNRFVNMGNAGVQGEMFDMSSEPTTITDVFLHTPSGKYWKVYSADKQKYVCQKNGDFEYQDNGTKIKFEE